MDKTIFPPSSPVDTPEQIESIWGVSRTIAGCPACKQVFLVPNGSQPSTCPLCFQADLSPQPVFMRCEPPELLVEPRVGRATLNLSGIFSNFVSGVYLHHPDFTPEMLAQRAMFFYWPMWLIDAQVSGTWQAESGFDYQVKSSKEAYHSGSWMTTEQLETRVRWEPRCGQIDRKYENVTVPAYSGHSTVANRVGSYLLEQAVPFTGEVLAEAPILLPDTHPENIWPVARSFLDKSAGVDCTQAAAAQHIRNFGIQATYADLHWTQLLLPVYVTYYTDDAGQRRGVMVNGQTGQVGGVRWASQKKGWLWAGIYGGITLGLLLLAVMSFLLSAVFPPAVVISALLAFIAVFTGGAAIFCAVWPWHWNRQQTEPKVSILG